MTGISVIDGGTCDQRLKNEKGNITAGLVRIWAMKAKGDYANLEDMDRYTYMQK